MIVNTFDEDGSGSGGGGSGGGLRTSNKCSNLDLSFKADACQKNYKLGNEFRNSNSQLHHVQNQCNAGVEAAVVASNSQQFNDSKA